MASPGNTLKESLQVSPPVWVSQKYLNKYSMDWKFAAEIHGPQKRNPNDFGDPSLFLQRYDEFYFYIFLWNI